MQEEDEANSLMSDQKAVSLFPLSALKMISLSSLSFRSLSCRTRQERYKRTARGTYSAILVYCCFQLCFFDGRELSLLID